MRDSEITVLTEKLVNSNHRSLLTIPASHARSESGWSWHVNVVLFPKTNNQSIYHSYFLDMDIKYKIIKCQYFLHAK